MKWSSEQFDEVDWDMLDATLEKKPGGYKMRLSKQHTGFCGTTQDYKYPNTADSERSKPGAPTVGE